MRWDSYKAMDLTNQQAKKYYNLSNVGVLYICIFCGSGFYVDTRSGSSYRIPRTCSILITYQWYSLLPWIVLGWIPIRAAVSSRIWTWFFLDGRIRFFPIRIHSNRARNPECVLSLAQRCHHAITRNVDNFPNCRKQLNFSFFSGGKCKQTFSDLQWYWVSQNVLPYHILYDQEVLIQFI